MKIVEVVAAAIIEDNKVFMCQRPKGKYLAGYYEFPGGKIEKNETHYEALKREIKEELNTLIDINNLLIKIEYDYPEFHLIMHLYECSVLEGELELMEHSDAKWIDINELNTFNCVPADKEIIEKLPKIYLCTKYKDLNE